MATSQFKVISLKEITPTVMCWAVKVQVSKVWKIVEDINGRHVGRFNMMLFDIEGDQIELTIREDVWNYLRVNMVVGKLYILQNVSVMRNDVEFRLANHDYKLELTRFSMVTSMVPESFYEESCLKPVTMGELIYADHPSLLYSKDIAGWISATSSVEHFVKDRSVIQRLFTQLTDGQNTIECVFCDEYVEVILDLLRNCNCEPPFVALQYTRVRASGAVTHGEIYAETVCNVTNIIISPNLPFILNSGLRLRPDNVSHIPLGPITKDLYDKFLILNSHKRIADLHLIGRGGLCVVWAKIMGFMDNQPWWELEDRERLVEYNDTSHYQNEISVPIIPSYSLIVQVYDESGTAWFKLPKSDVTKLLNVECEKLLLSTKNLDTMIYPAEVMSLIGKDLLFLIERRRPVRRPLCSISNCHDGYSVHQICHDKQVLRMYYTKKYLTEAHQLTAETVAQTSAIENAKMFVTQPAPEATIFEWIKKQKEEVRLRGLAGRKNHGNQGGNDDCHEAGSS